MGNWHSTVEGEVNRENVSATWAFFSCCDVNISCATSVAVWATGFHMYTDHGAVGRVHTAMGLLARCIQPWGCWQGAYSHGAVGRVHTAVGLLAGSIQPCGVCKWHLLCQLWQETQAWPLAYISTRPVTCYSLQGICLAV